MDHTPKRTAAQDKLQVPSSSPINGNSLSNGSKSGHNEPTTNANGTKNDDKHKAEMRKRFYAHKFWPIISKRFYYLTEPELFKAMVKGKGNLREISQWLAENVSLNERLSQYDAAQQAKREADEKSRQQSQDHVHKQEPQRPSASPFTEGAREEDIQGASNISKTSKTSGSPVSSGTSGTSTRLGSLQKPGIQGKPGVSAENSHTSQRYDDEDASPVKAAGKARQKRSAASIETKPAAPDTKIHLLKPKVSILEKYRMRQQPKIDHMFTNPKADEAPKRRRLVRAGDVDQLVITDSGTESSATDASRPSSKAPVSANASQMSPAERLAQKYSFHDDSVPRLKHEKPTDVVDVEADELDLLEQKIRANRKKRNAVHVVSDGELEEEVFSDDMSEEDEAAYQTGFTSIDSQILEFLNQAPVADIAEICNIPPNTAELVVAKRPFKSIYSVAEEPFEERTPEPETKRRVSRKPLGTKIIERTEFSLKGYRAVDSLVKQCSEYGKLISRQMQRWGVKVTGEGELDMVDVNLGGESKKSEEAETEGNEAKEEEASAEKTAEKTTKKTTKKTTEKVAEKAADEAALANGKAKAESASMAVGESDDDDDDDDDLATGTRGLTYVKHKPTLLAPDVELKTYQQVGINWLHLLYKNKLSCILADEMGLGKTCQVISFMAYLKSTAATQRPHLVVVPSSTLENWLREFQKFCPDMVVQAYYGSQAEREDLRYELAEGGFDVLVTTYNLATGAAPDFKFLRSQNFDMIVYDEGHMLKNSNSERYNKLMRLKAGFRLLLTGTPLQNNLKELVSLLAFMLPDLFVEKREDLQGLFNKTAMLNSSKDYNPLLSQQAINKAKTMMTPFVLRRKKAQVLKYLPEKSHFVARCEMTPTQREIYDDFIKKGKAVRVERERRKLLTGKEAEEAKAFPVQSSSNVMMSLRKASMHPLLFRRIYDNDKLKEMSARIMGEPQYLEANRDYIIEDMQVMSDYELNGLCEKFPKSLGSFILEESRWLDSGKVTKLLEIVRAVIERKEKVLVFSLFTQMLDVLEKILSFANITFVRLDGSTTVDTRQDIIDRFYEDETIPVFLLSTKAGGFGINLVAANNVVIYDQSFNPHDDKQAEDRAHRVGQTQEVLVTRLISTNTIDENILMLAENKLQLDQSISNEPSDSKFEDKAASMFEKLLFEN